MFFSFVDLVARPPVDATGGRCVFREPRRLARTCGRQAYANGIGYAGAAMAASLTDPSHALSDTGRPDGSPAV
jgi:hypothetical protein